MVCLPDKPVGVYRPRQALESDLHHLIREHFDEFRNVYHERFARTHGFWRPIFDKAVREFLKCGDLRHGFARVRCPDCRHEFLVAFSCKQRCICPSCDQKRTVLFGLHVAEDVCLPVPHRQFVWTVPKRLRTFFRFHRKLLHKLPGLAWQSLLEVYRSLLGEQAVPGGILGIQTFGQLLHYHPHIHGLVTDGAFAPDGRFLPLPENLGHDPFLRLWEDKVFALLLDDKKIDPPLVAQLRSWRHSGFGVDRSVHLTAGDRGGVENLAQYLARSPFSLGRLVRITESGQVVYRAQHDRPQRFPDPASEDLLNGVSRNFQVFEPFDFLAELLQHIPNKGEHLIRYYGHYSNKARGMQAKHSASQGTGSGAVSSSPPQCLSPLPDPCPDPSAQSTAAQPPPGPQPPCQPPAGAPWASPARRRGWAILIKRVYNADPLLCPQCGGTMKIISFIEARQEDVIRKILEHCKLWEDPPPRAPPPRARPGLPDPLRTSEVDPDFLEYSRREKLEQLDPPLQTD
jgi:ribosomal protein S27E